MEGGQTASSATDGLEEGVSSARSAEGSLLHGEGSQSKSQGATGQEGEVLLSMQTMSARRLKLLFRVLYASIEVAFAALVAILTLKFSGWMEGINSTRPLLYINAAVSLLGAAVLWVGFGMLVLRVRKINRMGLKWGIIRHRLVVTVMIETALMAGIDVLSLVPNLYVLSRDCGYFDLVPLWGAYASPVLWGTLLSLYVFKARFANAWPARRDWSLGPGRVGIMLQGPLWIHWPIALYWALWQGVILVGHVSLLDKHAKDKHLLQGLCEENSRVCFERTWPGGVSIASTALAYGYFAIYLVHMKRSFKLLHCRSYDQHRWGFIRLRYDLSTIGPAFLFLLLSHSLLFAIDSHSCFSYTIVIFGYVPPEVVFNVLTAINVVFFMPTWQQNEDQASIPVGDRLAWTETVQFRRQGLSKQEGLNRKRDGLSCALQASFCFETAVKVYYLCEAVYEHCSRAEDAKLQDAKLQSARSHRKPVGQRSTSFDLSVAMNLYNLEHCKFVKEKLDTNALIAWNETTIVVSFRGTYSATNLLTDLQLWRLPHPEPRGHFWLGTMPLVHKGFLQSWKALSSSIESKILEIVGSPGFKKADMWVLLTGHSLGGAIAQLAAYDIRKLLSLREDQVSVYTLGCPRVGNHAFAHDYSKFVPDTWHVVNHLDAIAKAPKLWILYKHCGHKVVINGLGHLIVSPTFLEMKLTSAFASSRIHDHLLSGYRKSLCAIVRAQFIKDKGLPGGRNALAELMRGGLVSQVLGVDGRAVAELESWGSRAWEKEKQIKIDKLRKKLQAAATCLCLPLVGCVSGAKNGEEESAGAQSMNAEIAGLSASNRGKSDQATSSVSTAADVC